MLVPLISQILINTLVNVKLLFEHVTNNLYNYVCILNSSLNKSLSGHIISENSGSFFIVFVIFVETLGLKFYNQNKLNLYLAMF